MTPYGVKQGPTVCDTPILVISIAQWGLINDNVNTIGQWEKKIMITVIGFANTVGQGLMVLYSEVPEVGEKSGQLLNYILQEQTMLKRIYNSIMAMRFSAMFLFTFQLDNTNVWFSKSLSNLT